MKFYLVNDALYDDFLMIARADAIRMIFGLSQVETDRMVQETKQKGRCDLTNNRKIFGATTIAVYEAAQSRLGQSRPPQLQIIVTSKPSDPVLEWASVGWNMCGSENPELMERALSAIKKASNYEEAIRFLKQAGFLVTEAGPAD